MARPERLELPTNWFDALPEGGDMGACAEVSGACGIGIDLGIRSGIDDLHPIRNRVRTVNVGCIVQDLGNVQRVRSALEKSPIVSATAKAVMFSNPNVSAPDPPKITSPPPRHMRLQALESGWRHSEKLKQQQNFACMPAFVELLQEEPEPSVRVVLGHFIENVKITNLLAFQNTFKRTLYPIAGF